LLALNRHEKIGSQTLKKIVAAFSNIEDVWRVSQSILCEKLGNNISSYIMEARRSDPDDVIKKIVRSNIGYITLYDNDYPKLLKQLPDAPVVLYIRGDFSILSKMCLGVVGSRKYSEYGKKLSYKLSKECSSAGLVIVSGLALGIDSFAHRGALDADGHTVGVLGCGIDQIYPASNFGLAKEMIDKGSVVISEFPPGTPPLKFNFPTRNRIVAGLCLGTLVIEAREKSGALITAYQSLDYNRDVFALPGNIDCDTSWGSNKLIQEGAKLVLSADDILTEFKIKLSQSVDKKEVILEKGSSEEIVYNILKSGEKIVNDIVIESGLNIIALNTALTLLEMKGIIKNLGGGKFTIN